MIFLFATRNKPTTEYSTLMSACTEGVAFIASLI